MGRAAHQISGHYPDLLVDGDMSDDIKSDWINCADKRIASFETEYTVADNPEGTITIEATNRSDPGDNDGHDLGVPAIVSPDGTGTVTFDLTQVQVNGFLFLRWRYVEIGGGTTPDLVQVRANLK